MEHPHSIALMSLTCNKNVQRPFELIKRCADQGEFRQNQEANENNSAVLYIYYVYNIHIIYIMCIMMRRIRSICFSSIHKQ